MSRYALASAALATLLTTTAAAPAGAVLLQYTLTGSDSTGAPELASFQVDSQPFVLPNNVGPGLGFRLKVVPGSYQYGQTILYDQDVEFNSASQGGGFFTLDPADTTGDSFLVAVLGQQLYSGSEAHPTLLTGDFILYDAFDYTSGILDSPLRLTVSEVSAGVPEPATWALMTLGFGGVGCTLRRRQKAAITVRFA